MLAGFFFFLVEKHAVGVVAIRVDFPAAGLVKNTEVQIKAAAHFHQPLVNQAVGHQNQYPLDALFQQLLVKNKASFDGFAQADFVCQQHAWLVSLGDVAGNIKLMGK